MIVGLKRRYSPRMWRWSLAYEKTDELIAVFSTYVEVILTITPTAGYKVSILHVCGGDPDTRIIVSKLDLYSPRMWRWSSKYEESEYGEIVFSTYVEVILKWSNHGRSFWSILHVCGGDPFSMDLKEQEMEYSPRMWRWSSNHFTWWW